jgi:hypothetical protein
VRDVEQSHGGHIETGRHMARPGRVPRPAGRIATQCSKPEGTKHALPADPRQLIRTTGIGQVDASAPGRGEWAEVVAVPDPVGRRLWPLGRYQDTTIGRNRYFNFGRGANRNAWTNFRFFLVNKNEIQANHASGKPVFVQPRSNCAQPDLRATALRTGRNRNSDCERILQ